MTKMQEPFKEPLKEKKPKLGGLELGYDNARVLGLEVKPIFTITKDQVSGATVERIDYIFRSEDVYKALARVRVILP